MDIKNATRAKSVRFPVLEKYRFYGYTFELPVHQELIEIQIVGKLYHNFGKRYIARTTSGDITLKACPRCKRLLPESEYYKKHSSCKVCHRLLTKSWTKRHPELAKKYAKKYSIKYRYHKKLIAAGLK